MTVLPQNAFSGLTAIAEIILPEEMTSGYPSAFIFCGTSRIDLPSTMINIGTPLTIAFGNNTNLTAIYTNATSALTLFDGPIRALNPGSVTVYVPLSVLPAQSSTRAITYGLNVYSQ